MENRCSMGLFLLALVLGAGTPPTLPSQEPAKLGGGVRLTARVDGYTMATMFNPQKYPFRYTGSATVEPGQLAALGQAGEVPAATTKALLGCLLWPKQGDTLEKAVLKSDGKKLSGEARVLHKYGQQGTHVLAIKLEGSFEENRLTLRATEVTVSGMWDYGGGFIKLTGQATVEIETAR